MAIEVAIGILGGTAPERPAREVPVDRVADLRGRDDAAADMASLLVGFVEIHRAAADIVARKTVERRLHLAVKEDHGNEILGERRSNTRRDGKEVKVRVRTGGTRRIKTKTKT